jgi:glycogen debranching enzyme
MEHGTAPVQLTIIDGTTFCICDDLGDVRGEAMGFFADDLRYLSLLRLTINGERPLLLTSGRLEDFMAAFHLRNPVARGLPPDSLTLVRRRFVVGDALQDQLVLENVSERAVDLELRLELGADFADIITVKEHDFSLGHPTDAPPLPPLRECRWDEPREARLTDGDGSSTHVALSKGGETDVYGSRFRIALAPRERWELLIDVFPSTARGQTAPKQEDARFRDEVACARDSLAAWHLRVPQLRASWHSLGAAFDQSVADLAALRMRNREGGGRLPAAGAPWFMTVFGRDTLVTCLQTVLLGPDLGRAALETLAALQATEDDPSIDAEPGKIIHEIRHGKAAQRWFGRYYGTVDATPLFLVLLSEIWRWTDDWALADRFRGPALSALRWIDEYGDRDGDGFVEYERRTDVGLENQSWKDSWDSQRFADGRIAKTPIAPAEVQGYAYDAKIRLAEMALAVWRDRELANRLKDDAAALARRFDEAFWVDDGAYYALALDRDDERVDSHCSNMGQLLWSGIVPPHRVDAIADQLFGDGLWSGWGVRTMSRHDGGYGPLSYHNGTVWPHDNSLIAWGLARYGRHGEARRIARALFDAAAEFSYALPEVFTGLARSATPFPVPYPTANRPQAWAAATPILLLRVVLGLEPERERATIVSRCTEPLPAWLEGTIVQGIPAFGSAWDVVVEGGAVRVSPGEHAHR